MTTSQTLTMPDGRTVGFADFGPADGRAVLWCHGGPGSRFEPSTEVDEATDAGFRLIGVDRPGYGLSTARPGRSIADWVPDARAVLDELGVDRTLVVGVSTGGAYALALAAAEPDRVEGVIACCALTDMRWAEGRAAQVATMGAIWDTSDRDEVLAIAESTFGADGSKLFEPPPEGSPGLPPADVARTSDPAWLAAMATSAAAMFAQGVQGYADDRLADGVGWVSFDPGAVRAPTIVLHGGQDSIVDVAQAGHTASLVPGARTKVVDDLAHLSIVAAVVETLGEL